MTLIGVRIYEFDRDLRLTTMRIAESGRFAGRRATGSSPSVRRRPRSPPTARAVDGRRPRIWETVLRPSLLTVYQVAPERLELGTL